MSDLAFLSLAEVAAAIKGRDLSPVELTQLLLDRIDDVDSRLHSYRTVLAAQALEQARQAERELAHDTVRGPLHGIPIVVKDLCFTAGSVTTCGATMLAGWRPDYDATVVTRLAAAGAILLGKLHMTEFALRWHHPAWPIPTNPWGDNLWPGVSSSGSGVATAAGLCYAALGSDTGGSIRFPAACNGVVGLKPTFGRVSRYGVFPLAASLDNVGPLTRTVADAAVMLGAIAGHDPHDPMSSYRPVPDYVAALKAGVAGLRIGIDPRFITASVHPEVSAAVLAAVEDLRSLGATVVEVTVPEIDDPVATWTTLCAADALAAHAELGLYPARRDEYGPFRAWLEIGAAQRGQDYAAAHARRLAFTGQLAGVFEQVDVLACPAMPTPPPPMGDDGLPVLQEGYQRARFTYPFNFSNSPTLTLPCGFSTDGQPIALQLVGRHFEEETILRAGHTYEQATDWHTRRPPLGA